MVFIFSHYYTYIEHRFAHTDKFFDTIYGGMRIFSLVKFATSLLTLLAGGILFLSELIEIK